VPRNFRFGGFELRPEQRVLLSDGSPVRLGGRAFDILLALVERRDRVVDCDELLDVVWPGLAVEENNLSVQISTLRRLLGPDSIATIRGRGYRFTAPTSEVQPGDEAATDVPSRLLCQAQGALVAVEGPTGAVLDCPTGGRVIQQTADWAAIAFAHARDAARAVLKMHRDAERSTCGDESRAPPRFRFGMVRVNTGPGAVSESQRAHLALALARVAGPNEIVVADSVVVEFVADVDGDIEDLGDLDVRGEMVRAYRVRHRGMPSAGPLIAFGDQGDVRPGIAVLPFDCVGPDAGNEVLGEALADDVIGQLSRNPGFNVISGLSSRRLRRCGLTPADAGACLSASFLLTGTCHEGAGSITLNVSLQDLRRGSVLRSIRIEVPLRDAFDPSHRVGSRIAEEVGQTVFQHAVQYSKNKPLPELANYALLMGAVSLMHRAAPSEFERARVMMDHLMRRPACQSVACAWLAKWHVLRVVQGWSPDPSADARLALEYVAGSLEHDSRDALALSIGGLVHAYLRKDLTTAGQLYEQAIDANPSEPLAWLFSATRFAYLGQGEEAETSGERALRLSPIDPLKYFFDSLAATAALANSNWDRSVALSHRSLKANRAHASTWRTLAIALVKMNKMDEARDAVQRLLAIEPGLTIGRFRERFPGRDGPLAEPFAEALKAAGVPN
jgi:adenylate cyclase